MDLTSSVTVCLQKYATFTGRASRSEYWWFTLVITIVTFLFSLIDVLIFSGLVADIELLSTLFSIATLLPSIAVSVRRLHDTDRTGWWLLLMFVPVIGWLVLIYFHVLKGTVGDNEYGHETTVDI